MVTASSTSLHGPWFLVLSDHAGARAREQWEEMEGQPRRRRACKDFRFVCSLLADNALGRTAVCQGDVCAYASPLSRTLFSRLTFEVISRRTLLLLKGSKVIFGRGSSITASSISKESNSTADPPMAQIWKHVGEEEGCSKGLLYFKGFFFT